MDFDHSSYLLFSTIDIFNKSLNFFLTFFNHINLYVQNYINMKFFTCRFIPINETISITHLPYTEYIFARIYLPFYLLRSVHMIQFCRIRLCWIQLSDGNSASSISIQFFKLSNCWEVVLSVFIRSDNWIQHNRIGQN